FEYTPPPTLNMVQVALEDVGALLHPHRPKGIGRKLFTGDDLLRDRMVMMQSLFWTYIKMPFQGWMKASQTVLHINQGGPHLARNLQAWCQAFLIDRHDLPFNPWGLWNQLLLEANEELAEEVKAHLQSVGKYVCAADIVHYMLKQDVQERYSLKKGVCLSTAHVWMHALEYRW
ncbi:hypothetical protein C8Q72DRAFT_766217, partial [Fomitopsis betulina]